jgi:hypothetical protein
VVVTAILNFASGDKIVEHNEGTPPDGYSEKITERG